MPLRTRTILLITLVVLALGFALWRTAVIRSEQHAQINQWKQDRQKQTDTAQARYRTVANRAASEVSTIQDWIDLLQKAGVFVEAGVEGEVLQERVDELVSHTAEFLYYRFSQDDPDAYIAWRKRSGYTLRPREELIERLFVADDYEWLFGKPLPFDAPMERVFAEMWRRSPTSFGNSQRLAWIPSDPAGIAVAVGSSREPSVNPSAPALPAAGPVPWYGPANATLRNWWAGTTSYQDLARKGPVLVANVGIVAGFESGDYRSMVILAYFDEVSGLWRIHSLHQFNHTGRTVSAMEL